MSKFLLLAPILVTAFATAASSQEVSVNVGYADLDLTSDEGVDRLDHRIDAAVRAVCGDHLGQKPLSTMLAIRRCGKLTRADISSPRQVAIERARGKIPSVEVASGGSFAVTARRR